MDSPTCSLMGTGCIQLPLLSSTKPDWSLCHNCGSPHYVPRIVLIVSVPMAQPRGCGHCMPLSLQPYWRTRPLVIMVVYRTFWFECEDRQNSVVLKSLQTVHHTTDLVCVSTTNEFVDCSPFIESCISTFLPHLPCVYVTHVLCECMLASRGELVVEAGGRAREPCCSTGLAQANRR